MHSEVNIKAKFGGTVAVQPVVAQAVAMVPSRQSHSVSDGCSAIYMFHSTITPSLVLSFEKKKSTASVVSVRSISSWNRISVRHELFSGSE